LELLVPFESEEAGAEEEAGEDLELDFSLLPRPE